MKVEREESKFKPVTVTITVESQEEMDYFNEVGFYCGTVSQILSQLSSEPFDTTIHMNTLGALRKALLGEGVNND